MSEGRVWLDDTEITAPHAACDISIGDTNNTVEIVIDIDCGALGEELTIRLPYERIAELVATQARK